MESGLIRTALSEQIPPPGSDAATETYACKTRPNTAAKEARSLEHASVHWCQMCSAFRINTAKTRNMRWCVGTYMHELLTPLQIHRPVALQAQAPAFLERRARHAAAAAAASSSSPRKQSPGWFFWWGCQRSSSFEFLGLSNASKVRRHMHNQHKARRAHGPALLWQTVYDISRCHHMWHVVHQILADFNHLACLTV